MNIGGWQLLRTTAGGIETTFKFHRSVKLEGGATVTVWSSDAGANHEPPGNIVMNTQKWYVGDNTKTLLLNADAVEVAASERVRHQISSHASRRRESSNSHHLDDAGLQRQERAGSSGSSVGVSSIAHCTA